MVAVLALILAQNFGVPTGPIFSTPSTMRNYAYFELAPTSGAGMGSACSCTNVTGARGETISWSRSGSAYCTKEGPATTGLTTTSMVSCPTNTPRVSSVGGYLRLLSEPGGTNLLLWNQDASNGAWLLDGAPTVNTDTATTAWSTATFDTITDNDGAALAGIYQTVTTALGTYTCSVYLRGSTSTTPLVQVQDVGGSGTQQQATPTLSTSTITRVVLPAITTAGATTGFRILLYPAGASAAQTGAVFAGGFQCESGTWASSLILTTTAAASRSLDTASTTGVSLSAVATSGCAAISILPLNTTLDLTSLVGGSNARYLYLTAPNLRSFDGTNNPSLAAGLVAGTEKRYRSTWSGATLSLFNATDATSTSGSFDGTQNDDGTLRFAETGIVGAGPAYFGQLQIDPSPARCQ